MAPALDSPAAARTGAGFELDAVDAGDGRLVVRGRWSGVRGLRFVRPALVVDGRQVLATLDHKPWAPDADPWIAVFPWNGPAPDASDVLLAVAPSVTVRLDGSRQTPEAPAAGAPRARRRPDRELEDLRRARAQAERERDLALAQRDEAVAARAAAIRTRDRMEVQRDEARRAQAAAEAARDQALSAREEARAQRDEILLAHRSLQREVEQQWAAVLRGPDEPEALPDPHPEPGEPPAADDAPLAAEDRPLGVRAIPAARAQAPQLARRVDARAELSRYDLWAIRFFATIAAGAFVLLLVLLLRVFI